MNQDELLELFWYWIRERQAIYERRLLGLVKPWSNDPIFQTCKFTNVYRELDRTSRWVARNWRTPHNDDPHVWFAMAVSVMTNNIDTMEALGYPVPWDRQHFETVLWDRRERGLPVFGNAYLLTTHRHSIPKITYYANILDRLWNMREKIPACKTLNEIHFLLTGVDGIASFISGQIIAAYKYADSCTAKGFDTFAVSGPGSRRGLARLNGYPPTYNWREEDWYHCLYHLQEPVTEHTEYVLHLQDLQNCCCEFDKYVRVKTGEGRIKQKYNGKE